MSRNYHKINMKEMPSFSFLRLRELKLERVGHALIPMPGKQKQGDLYEFQASLVYLGGYYSPARMT